MRFMKVLLNFLMTTVIGGLLVLVRGIGAGPFIYQGKDLLLKKKGRGGRRKILSIIRYSIGFIFLAGKRPSCSGNQKIEFPVTRGLRT